MVSEKEDFEQSAVSIDRVTHSILWIRDQKVMLSTVWRTCTMSKRGR